MKSTLRTSAWLSLLGILGCSYEEALSPAPGPADASVRRCPELSDTDPWEGRLGDLTLADRGRLLACAHIATFTGAQAANTPPFPPDVEPATHGYDLFVIQYISEARPAVAGAVTALVYVPSGGVTDLPIVALGHGTLGMGPSCGPSHVPGLTDGIAVPLAGRGYAVVAPDYPGRGVDNGMTSYLVGAAEAASTLDGVRALRQLRDPRFDAAQLGRDFFVAGHSQGGHAALFTHQLFDPSLDVRFLGSIAMAPGLGSARAWATFFTGASRPVGVMETFALSSLYARMLHAARKDAVTTVARAVHDGTRETTRIASRGKASPRATPIDMPPAALTAGSGPGRQRFFAVRDTRRRAAAMVNSSSCVSSARGWPARASRHGQFVIHRGARRPDDVPGNGDLGEGSYQGRCGDNAPGGIGQHESEPLDRRVSRYRARRQQLRRRGPEAAHSGGAGRRLATGARDRHGSSRHQPRP